MRTKRIPQHRHAEALGKAKAGAAAGDAFPAGKYLFDDEAEGERRNRQVDALDAQRRQPDDDAHALRDVWPD